MKPLKFVLIVGIVYLLSPLGVRASTIIELGDRTALVGEPFSMPANVNFSTATQTGPLTEFDLHLNLDPAVFNVGLSSIQLSNDFLNSPFNSNGLGSWFGISNPVANGINFTAYAFDPPDYIYNLTQLGDFHMLDFNLNVKSGVTPGSSSIITLDGQIPNNFADPQANSVPLVPGSARITLQAPEPGSITLGIVALAFGMIAFRSNRWQGSRGA